MEEKGGAVSEAVIRAEGLGKRYQIGERQAGGLLRDKLARALRQPLSVFRRKRREEFWALKGVNLEVREGEVLGLIGRNGAGKTTLLKILSRITRPTTGWAEVRGHVGSLLEVGTGFHPELTGRENTFLSGAILGMKKAEIERKFEEIVAFAEIEKFIDTPVKHYSSGMYVRLAFAVAAHLEPEILLVDEVLAVGDLKFQKKCLGKMGDVARAGRTVVFVSHNMGAITRLCPRAIWLEEGSVVCDGPSGNVIREYEARHLSVCSQWERSIEDVTDGVVHFLTVRVQDSEQRPTAVFAGDAPVFVEVRYQVRRPLGSCQIGIRVCNAEGLIVLTTTDADRSGASAISRDPGFYRASFSIPAGLLVPGAYYLWVAAHLPNRTIYEIVEQAVVFEVSAAGSLVSMDGRAGTVAPLLLWETEMEAPL